mgnify:CR=1 FL=1
MPEEKPRPLSLGAIFYDVIFTFVIVQLARNLLFTNAGSIDWHSVAAYVMLMLAGWTVWTYQIIYASRVQARPVRDNLFLALDMFLNIYLTTTLTILHPAPEMSTKLTTALLLLSIAIQYAIDGRGGWRKHLVFIAPLVTGSLLIFGSILPGKSLLGSLIFFAGILVPALAPWLGYHRQPDEISHFKTISQRLSLFTILVFARAIVQVTDSLADLDIPSILFFFIIALLMVSYTLVATRGVSKETTRSSMLAILIHLPITGSILMMANVTRMYIFGRLLPEYFAFWMLALMALYTISVGAYLGLYHGQGLDLNPRRIFFYVVSFAIFTLFGLVTVRFDIFFMLGTCAYLVACILYLWQFVLNPPVES